MRGGLATRTARTETYAAKMHIPLRLPCQRFVSLTAAALFQAGLLCWPVLPAWTQTRAPAASPPAWEQELAAARVLQTAAALAPSGDAGAARVRQERLGQLYRDLAAKYPLQSAVQQAAGDYFEGSGAREAAVPYWQRAISLNPQNAAGAAALGNAALDRGDVRAARDDFQRAVTAQPGDSRYHFDLGNVLYLFRHDLADPPGAAGSEAAMVAALEQFRLAAALAPLDPSLAEAYAQTFYMLAQPNWVRALAAWQKVRLLEGQQADFANAHLARVSLRLGKADQADGFLQAMHDPRFDGLKANLHGQAMKLRQQPAPAP
jgi:tetratricopeptide (TPR) repeat protein